MGLNRRSLNVAVIGCGIAGPAAAILLHRGGHRVQVFEKSPQLTNAGAGILLSPSGLFVLNVLGVLDESVRAGSKVIRISGRSVSGRPIMDLRYRNLRSNLFGLGIHRGSLSHLLRSAMEKLGIEVRTGFEITGIDEGFLMLPGGSREGPFDVIVVADGAHSSLRSPVETSCKPYPYGAIWTSAQNWGDYPDNILSQVYDGTSRMVGVLPSGSLPMTDGRTVSLFWSARLRDFPDLEGLDLEGWKQSVLALAPETAGILEQVESKRDLTLARYWDSRVTSPVHENVVFIGDAAHAMSPQLGQGASLALMDALSVATALSNEENVLAALYTYREERLRNIRFYQRASKWMTPFFQSDQRWLGPLRNFALPLACAIPVFQQEMVRTMIGTKAGTYSSILLEEAILDFATRWSVALAGRVAGPDVAELSQ